MFREGKKGVLLTPFLSIVTALAACSEANYPDKLGKQVASNEATLAGRANKIDSEVNKWYKLTQEERNSWNAEVLRKAAKSICNGTTKYTYLGASVQANEILFVVYLYFNGIDFKLELPLTRDKLTPTKAEDLIRNGILDHNLEIF